MEKRVLELLHSSASRISTKQRRKNSSCAQGQWQGRSCAKMATLPKAAKTSGGGQGNVCWSSLRWVKSKWVSARPGQEKAKRTSIRSMELEVRSQRLPSVSGSKVTGSMGLGSRSELSVKCQSRQAGHVSETESALL